MSPPHERSGPRQGRSNAQVFAHTQTERSAAAGQSGATERTNLGAVLAVARRIAAGRGRCLT